jgi:hypothetical protein
LNVDAGEYRFLFENLALGVQHAHGVLAVSEVESNGDGGFPGFIGSGILPYGFSPGPAAFSSILVRLNLSYIPISSLAKCAASIRPTYHRIVALNMSAKTRRSSQAGYGTISM